MLNANLYRLSTYYTSDLINIITSEPLKIFSNNWAGYIKEMIFMLSGKTILDLSWVLGGPFAGQLLAQLGADVIKVETLEGDLSRRIPPILNEHESPFFLSVNRGKRSIAIDLKTEAGKKTFYDLVKQADAVIYGFAPSVPVRLGVDFETLKTIKPSIVVAQLVGLHDKGEYADAPAFDLMIQALSGVMSITGEENGRPVRVGYQAADLVGGLYLALATVGALCKAESNHTGQYVQVSLFDTQVAMLSWQAQGWLCGGPIPEAKGSRHAMIAPSDIYRAADGVWIALSPTGEAFWQALCQQLGKPELAHDPRFNTPSVRIENVKQLSTILTECIKQKTSHEWLALFKLARVPAAPVLHVNQALVHPLIKERKMLEFVTHPDSQEKVSMLGNPFKFDGQPNLEYPPKIAADTEAVLQQLAGYSVERINALAQEKAIGILKRAEQ